ncbi:MAG: helix-turn-helix transcriptional regulator [Pseudohongiellaceae bacterium]
MIDYSELATTIGRNLRMRRREVFPRDTQIDMAARLGVSIATYSRMERGDARVSFRHYLTAADILGCRKDFGELFTHPDRREDLIDSLLREYGESL